jgi:DNA-binding CsgD family transcriptional regulator
LTVDTAILPEVPPGDHRRLPASITASARTPKLSHREREVLSWLALGKSGPEISIILDISVCTVRLHIRSIVRKLTASNIPHAVARAYQAGIFRCNPADEDIADR